MFARLTLLLAFVTIVAPNPFITASQVKKMGLEERLARFSDKFKDHCSSPLLFTELLRFLGQIGLNNEGLIGVLNAIEDTIKILHPVLVYPNPSS